MTSQQGTESSSLAISSAVEKQQSTLARIAQSPEDSEGTASSAAVASEAPNTLPTSASAAAKASRRRTKTGCLSENTFPAPQVNEGLSMDGKVAAFRFQASLC